MQFRIVILGIFSVVALVAFLLWNRDITHNNIVTTIFWVGEKKGSDNDYISNYESAWDNHWQTRYGGIDDPDERNGFFPAKFRPKENPFYVALPYNDFCGGRRKMSADLIPWAKEKQWGAKESMCKNRWVRISKGKKTAYAQWEDVGPSIEDDFDYVFGRNRPRNTFNARAGLDVSPAVATYLELKDIDAVDWKFVDGNDVPQGPWREIITASQIIWD